MSNLNDVRPKITHITLSDGIEREIKFTLNAMAEMEDKYGSVEAAFEALDKGSIKAARFVLWTGLMHAGLSEQQVGELIDVQCLSDIMSKVEEAFNNDMPPEGEQVPNATTLTAVQIPVQAVRVE